jgi:hypothetical protein
MGTMPLLVCERKLSEDMLAELPACTSPELRRIARLKERAIAAPERRKAIVAHLEGYMQRRKGTREGKAAQRAISMIIAVSMLEVLQG